MSDDRKAVILGRLQRVTTVTPWPQASCPTATLRQVPAQPGRLHRVSATCRDKEPQEGTCVPLTSVWPVLHTRRPSPSRTPANASHVFTE